MHTGIDPGLKSTGIVTLDNSGMVLYQTQFGTNENDILKSAVHENMPIRYKLYRDKLVEYLTTYNITGTVVIEEAMGDITGNGRKLLGLIAIYQLTLTDYFEEHKIFCPKATQIKKAFIHGAATKEEMIDECKRRGFYTESDHKADAYAMSCMSFEGKL